MTAVKAGIVVPVQKVPHISRFSTKGGRGGGRKYGNTQVTYLAHETKYLCRLEDHILLEICLLSRLPVDLERHGSRQGGERVTADQRRPDGREVVEGLGVEELPAAVLRQLEHAAGQIVADGVP